MPVVAVVAGAASVDLVPNTPRQPVAKAVVHGALSCVAAVSAAVAAFAAQDPHGMTALKLATVGLGAAAVWWIPEAGPDVAAIEAEAAKGAPLPQIIATVAADVATLTAGDHSPSMGSDLPAAATPRQVDAGLPNSAWSPKPVAAGVTASTAPAPASTPTPIGDAVSGPPTQPFPAIPAQPAAPAPAVVPVPTA